MIQKKTIEKMIEKAADERAASEKALQLASTFLDPKQAWVMFIDYAFVVTIYVTCGFLMGVLIDGYILKGDDVESIHSESSIEMYIKILLQLALQGFVVIVISLFIKEIPSPVEGVNGYDPHSPAGDIIRNPAIITVILFFLSVSLRARIMILFNRLTGVDPHISVVPTQQALMRM